MEREQPNKKIESGNEEGYQLLGVINQTAHEFQEILYNRGIFSRREALLALHNQTIGGRRSLQFLTPHPEQLFPFDEAVHVTAGRAVVRLFGCGSLIPGQYLQSYDTELSVRYELRRQFWEMIPDPGYRSTLQAVWFNSTDTNYNADVVRVLGALHTPERVKKARFECMDCVNYIAELAQQGGVTEANLDLLKQKIFDATGFMFSFLSTTIDTLGSMEPKQLQRIAGILKTRLEQAKDPIYAPWMEYSPDQDFGIAKVSVNLQKLFKSYQQQSAGNIKRGQGKGTHHPGFFPTIPSDRPPFIIPVPGVPLDCINSIVCNEALYRFFHTSKTFKDNPLIDIIQEGITGSENPEDLTGLNKEHPSCAKYYDDPAAIQLFWREQMLAGNLAPLVYQDPERDLRLLKYYSDIFGLTLPAGLMNGVLFPKGNNKIRNELRRALDVRPVPIPGYNQ